MNNGKTNRIEVKDVLYAPTLTGNLLSVKKLTDKGKTVEFAANECWIKDDKKLLAIGKLEGNLYKLLCEHEFEVANLAESDSEVIHQNCIHLWHRRLGHRDPNAIKQACKEGLASGICMNECDEYKQCSVCIKGKAARKP